MGGFAHESVVFLQASYGEFFALQRANGVHRGRGSREGSDARNAVLGCSAAYGLLVETGLASERRIHEQFDLSAFYEIDNMRSFLSHLEEKLRRYEMRAQELLGSGRGSDAEPKIHKVPNNLIHIWLVVSVYSYE